MNSAKRWSLHIMEIDDQRALRDCEIGRITVADDENLALAPIWSDRGFVEAPQLLGWIQGSPSPALEGRTIERPSARYLIEAMLTQLTQEHLNDLRRPCIVYLRPFPDVATQPSSEVLQ